ncbi:hypothetical protein [Pinirhizobacter soli]|uniref:hypothetical protein n=1 Tax=Pinirhizobacter soli TaxID=2786953 RepID=UPI00202A4F87|nr:hypothetical protein [Pinirhizobacter soli]
MSGLMAALSHGLSANFFESLFGVFSWFHTSDSAEALAASFYILLLYVVVLPAYLVICRYLMGYCRIDLPTAKKRYFNRGLMWVATLVVLAMPLCFLFPNTHPTWHGAGLIDTFRDGVWGMTAVGAGLLLCVVISGVVWTQITESLFRN